MATCPANLSGIDPDFDAYSSNGERVIAADLIQSDCCIHVPAAIPEVSNPSSCTESATFAFDVDTAAEVSSMKNSSSKGFVVQHGDLPENEVAFAETVEPLKKPGDFSGLSSEETLVCGSESNYFSGWQNSLTRQVVAATVVDKLPLDENAATPEEVPVDNAIAVGVSSSSSQSGSSVSIHGVHCPSCLQPPEEEGKDVASNEEAVCRPGDDKSEVRFSIVKVLSI